MLTEAKKREKQNIPIEKFDKFFFFLVGCPLVSTANSGEVIKHE
jgi:hypothetical protein